MKVKVQTLEGAKASGDIELSDAVFGLEPRADILHRVVTWQLENRRGTARATRERKLHAPARSGASRRAAAQLVTATARLRSSSVVVRLTAPALVTSTSR